MNSPEGAKRDLTWQPFAGLSVLASYAHVDARVIQDSFFPVGNRVDLVPENSGRLWGNYKFRVGRWKIFRSAPGSTRRTDRPQLDNQFFTLGFVTFDARIAYDFENYTFAVVGKNLADRRYFIPTLIFRDGSRPPSR